MNGISGGQILLITGAGSGFSRTIAIELDTGELVKEPVSVHFLGREILGALIVFEDEDLVHHELVLVKDRLKAIDDPPLYLGRGMVSVDDLAGVFDLLQDRLQQLVKSAVAKVGLNDSGVYFVVLGNLREWKSCSERRA